MNRNLYLPGLILTALGLAQAGESRAHLSIIRQGRESRGGIEANDRHGHALAAGDFNGDGYEDLATGIPYEDYNYTNAGAVMINWGTHFGLTHEGAGVYFASTFGGADQTSGQFGYALAAGDINGDGIDELAIGVPGDDLGIAANVGMVTLLRGTTSGPTFWLDLTQGTAGGSNEGGDRFGQSMVFGDFDANGYADLIVGAPGENSSTGVIYYFLGTSVGPFGGDGWYFPSAFGASNDPGEQFGYALAAGHVVGTTHDDLVVGMPWDGLADQGSICLIRGSAAGLTATGSSWYTAFDAGSLQNFGYFGKSLAVGKLFSGSTLSVAVGEPGRTVSNSANAGRVVVFPGGSSSLNTSGEVIVTEANAGGVVQASDRFGEAIAAGRFWDPADGYDDLAVGAPGDGLGFTSGAGQVQIFLGGANGPTGGYGWAGYNQGTMSEPVESGDELGFSLAFGEFDGTDFGNLAVGAPGERYEATYPGDATVLEDAGMIHIIAPWRQVYGIPARNAVAEDCEGNFVYTQKPFDRVKIASTTKALCVLIACERGSLPPNDPNFVELDDTYQVPAWCANNIGGSQVPLIQGEFMTLRNLMYVCMMVSGNDAAHAIADIIGDGATPDLRIADFVVEMNARAAAIGMNDSHFSNPNGFDSNVMGGSLGDHYSTAADMALLSRECMNNALFRQIVGTKSWTIPRYGSNFYYIQTFTSFINNMLNGIQNCTGIKGGSTPGAGITGIYTAKPPSDTDQAVATWFGSSSNSVSMTAGLLGLATGQCNTLWFPIVNSWTFSYQFANVSTSADSAASAAAVNLMDGTDGRDVDCDVISQDGLRASFSLETCRTSDLVLGYQESRRFGAAPFKEHMGIRILNTGMTPCTLLVEVSQGYGSGQAALLPGEEYDIPPYMLPAGSPPPATFELLITNDADVAAQITVEEVYQFDVPPTEVGPGMPLHTTRLLRDGQYLSDQAWHKITGMDPDGGALVMAYWHQPGVTSGVSDGPSGPAALNPLTVLPASPNPFTSRTRIAFEMKEPGSVSALIFDLSGRVVRTFKADALPSGRHGFEWDGTADSGLDVAAGIYFYRVSVDETWSGKGRLVLTR